MKKPFEQLVKWRRTKLQGSYCIGCRLKWDIRSMFVSKCLCGFQAGNFTASHLNNHANIRWLFRGFSRISKRSPWTFELSRSSINLGSLWLHTDSSCWLSQSSMKRCLYKPHNRHSYSYTVLYFQIVFEAVKSSGTSDIALDDISFSGHPCKPFKGLPVFQSGVVGYLNGRTQNYENLNPGYGGFLLWVRAPHINSSSKQKQASLWSGTLKLTMITAGKTST